MMTCVFQIWFVHFSYIDIMFHIGSVWATGNIRMSLKKYATKLLSPRWWPDEQLCLLFVFLFLCLFVFWFCIFWFLKNVTFCVLSIGHKDLTIGLNIFSFNTCLCHFFRRPGSLSCCCSGSAFALGPDLKHKVWMAIIMSFQNKCCSCICKAVVKFLLEKQSSTVVCQNNFLPNLEVLSIKVPLNSC